MENQVYPLHLRWKCIDDFTNMNKQKLFYRGNCNITNSVSVTLEPIFQSIKDRYLKRIQSEFLNTKTHFKIAGGNYTHFFILPELFKLAAKKYPFVPVELTLEEINNVDELERSEADVIVSATYTDTKTDLLKSYSVDYFLVRRIFDDKIFFATSKNTLDEYENMQAILDYHPILFGRIGDDFQEKAYSYSVKPKHRENETPKIVVDSYFMTYLLMAQGVGLHIVFSSYNKNDLQNFFIFNDCISIGRRIVFLKNKQKYAKNFSKFFFKVLKKNEKNEFRTKS